MKYSWLLIDEVYYEFVVGLVFVNGVDFGVDEVGLLVELLYCVFV